LQVSDVDRDHEVEWQYGGPTDATKLNGAASAQSTPGRPHPVRGTALTMATTAGLATND